MVIKVITKKILTNKICKTKYINIFFSLIPRLVNSRLTAVADADKIAERTISCII